MCNKSRIIKILAFSLFFVFLFSLMFTGCGPSAPEEPADTTPVEEREEPAVEEVGKEGGTLKMGISLNPTVLGYAPDMRTYQEFLISSTVLESLGRHDEEGLMQPWLAESWESDPDAEEVVVELRQGVKFHDGTDFNADAVKWNMDQFMEAGRAEANDLESVEVLDEYTVQFNLERWNSKLMDSLFYFVLMTSPTAFEENGEDWAASNPVGTGPFKFDSWERDVSVKFSKFDDYWQEGKPYLDGVEWSIIADPMSAMASFQAGEVGVLANIQPDIARQLEDSDGVIKQLETGLGAMAIGVAGDSENPDSPFADVRVRKAVSYAIDSESIVDNILHGYAVVTNQWGVPGAWSYNPDVEDYAHNPEKARELLEDAGYPDGFETKLTTLSSTMEMQVMTAVQSYLAEVGIDVEIEPVEVAHYREITGAGADPWEGLILYRGRGDPDVVTYMPRNFAHDGFLMVNGIITTDKIDTLLGEAAAAPDQETVTEIAHQLQKEVYEENCIITPLFVLSMPVVLDPDVYDTGLNEAQASIWTPAEAWIEQ